MQPIAPVLPLYVHRYQTIPTGVMIMPRSHCQPGTTIMSRPGPAVSRLLRLSRGSRSLTQSRAAPAAQQGDATAQVHLWWCDAARLRQVNSLFRSTDAPAAAAAAVPRPCAALPPHSGGVSACLPAGLSAVPPAAGQPGEVAAARRAGVRRRGAGGVSPARAPARQGVPAADAGPVPATHTSGAGVRPSWTGTCCACKRSPNSKSESNHVLPACLFVPPLCAAEEIGRAHV